MTNQSFSSRLESKRNSKFNLITILGPTAVGKTHLAVFLAKEFNGEIISADSRQVYKGMDIGTGKDLGEYSIDGAKIPYHLINILEPKEECNLFLFTKLFYESFNEINSRNKLPFLVGGTGLYLQSILKGYTLKPVEFNIDKYDELNKMDLNTLQEKLKKINPHLHNTTDLLIKERVIRAIIVSEEDTVQIKNDRKKIDSLVIGISMDRNKIKERISNRLKQRLANGMIEEVEKLINIGITHEKLDFFGLEYKYIGKYLRAELNYNDMYQKLNSAIHNFAKRQMTWFRKMEREGIQINWVDGLDYERAKKIITDNYFI